MRRSSRTAACVSVFAFHGMPKTRKMEIGQESEMGMGYKPGSRYVSEKAHEYYTIIEYALYDKKPPLSAA